MCVGTAVCFRYCRFRFWVFWFALFGLGVYAFDFVFVVMRFLVLPTVGGRLVSVLGLWCCELLWWFCLVVPIAYC